MSKANTEEPLLTVDQVKRFWSYVDKSTGQGPTGECWRWLRGLSTRGYGKFSANYRTLGAHRVAYFLSTGEWPADNACHSCDWPPCCNPAHVWPGTDKDNMEDASQKGRMSSGDEHYSRSRPDLLARGANHGSKLHPERLPRGDKHYSRLHPEQVLRGEKTGRAKLGEADISTIRQRHRNGETYVRIASDYPVQWETIAAICAKRIWAHVG